MELPGTIWLAMFLLTVLITYEVVYPKVISEGITNYVGPYVSPLDVNEKDNYFSPLLPRRGDIGINHEEKGYLQDPRYFRNYVDVQGFGFKHDFCRLVVPEKANSKPFFACALAGTNGLTSVSFKSNDTANGFRISRDDYMNDIHQENKDAYCRILKADDGTYQPLCLRAMDAGFNTFDEVDANPPKEIKTMLEFYDGIVGWLRFRDDMLDYTNTLIVQKAGGISIPEDPNPAATQGISFNGIDQYLRIADAKDLTLGNKIQMRSVRAFSVWVFFDSFTNNAHIFDFGDGPGNNNTHLSIIGKGDEVSNTNEIRPMLCGNQQNTLPDYPSGPHPCSETTPQNLMLLKANVNVFECKNFDVEPRKLSWKDGMKEQVKQKPVTASLLYEIWDSKQRKQRIIVPNAIPLKKWAHIVITATSNDSFRPDISIYVNGTQVHVEPSGYLPQAQSTTNNYLGKSNWNSQTSQYELKDELFNGKIFDFRMYNNVMSESKIKHTIKWGLTKLGIQ